MKARRLLSLSILAIVFGCEGHQSPTAPGAVKSVPLDSSAVLSDGAHGGNPDFYFLPPLVPFPRTSNFQLGKFNNTLKPSLKIEICELTPEAFNALPKPTTACNGPPIKTFAPGTVQLVNLPLRQWGWWTLFNLPPDGFYYVLWDTRQAGLNASKYYRIKVFIDGSTVPMGYADVDPMTSLREWRYALTGEVIQLVNGWLLPIPFRIQNGALCGGAISCTSETVGNTNPGGSKVVQVIGNDGVPVAGAKFPDGWLGPDPNTSVVVTISSVNTGPDNADKTEGTPCHATLGLQQFRSCFKFTTTPVLPFIGDTRKQFYVQVTAAVCYILQDTEDPREKFAELYASHPPTEPPHALTDASDVGILGVTGRNCGTNRYGLRSSNPLLQLASSGWDKLKGGLGRVFGVKTAYAVDLGLGGLLDGMSNIGPAVTAQIQDYGGTDITLGQGVTTAILRAKVFGNHVHHGEGAYTGINSMPVTFSVAPGNGSLQSLPAGPSVSQLGVMTSTFIDNSNEIPFSVDGVSSVIWTPPTAPGTYHMTATGKTTNGPVTYSVTVPPAITLASIVGDWYNVNPSTPNVTSISISLDNTTLSVRAFGQCSPTDCDWGWTYGDPSRWNSDQEITAVWNQGFAVKTQTLKWVSASRVRVTTNAAFAPLDGRTDYTIVEYFHRP